MSRQLPPKLTQDFTLEFNDKGYRKKVRCVLTIDMSSMRRQLGKGAVKNASKRSRDGYALVQLHGPVQTIGAETPEIGTVCYE